MASRCAGQHRKSSLTCQLATFLLMIIRAYPLIHIIGVHLFCFLLQSDQDGQDSYEGLKIMLKYILIPFFFMLQSDASITVFSIISVEV